MITYPVTVSDLSSTSTEKSISDFFSFCGKISSIQYDGAARSAVIHFEKEQAAKTALMLNGGTLDGVGISVASDAVSDEHSGSQRRNSIEGDALEQHDKPRAGIVAEMLAKGYAISESILNKAIEIDKNQGISTRFMNYIRGLDSAIGQKIGGPEATMSGTVSDKAKVAFAQGQAIGGTVGGKAKEAFAQGQAQAQVVGGKAKEAFAPVQAQAQVVGGKAKEAFAPVQAQAQAIGGTVGGKAKEAFAQTQAQVQALNEQHQISKQAYDYYSKAIASPVGQKVVSFYTVTAKQAQDVRDEAMRIAALGKDKVTSVIPAAAPVSQTAAEPAVVAAH